MRSMTRKLTLVAVVATAALLALAAAGGARSTKVTELKLHDEFAVKNTHLLCAVEISKTLIPGQKLVGCTFASSKGPVPKTYAVALGVNGEVVLAKVKAGGTPSVVTRRKPSVVRHDAAQLYVLSVGDGATVKGTAISCSINNEKVAKKTIVLVTCFKLDLASGKPRPNSYGIGITDGGAFLVHFDAKSKATPIKVVQHGK